MCIVYGPPAIGVSTCINHSPDEEDIMEYSLLFHEVVMETFVDFRAIPHKFTLLFCCNTILSPNITGKVIFAEENWVKQKLINNRNICLFIFLVN
jgi:hypothetical protein